MDCDGPPPALDADSADELQLPDADALVAGTVALMTAWADPCPQARLPMPQLRQLLARKVVSNLFFLQHHPGVSPGLRQALSQAHRHWVTLAQDVPIEPARVGPHSDAEPDTDLAPPRPLSPQTTLH